MSILNKKKLFHLLNNFLSFWDKWKEICLIKCEFLTYVIFVRGRLLLFLGPGVKKPSYATGAWLACIDYDNKLHLIWCMMYATSLNVCSSIDIWYFTSCCNCNRPIMPPLHWNTLENFGCKMTGTNISVISVLFALIKHLITNTRNIQQFNLPDV
jgi:hypothetical protein